MTKNMKLFTTILIIIASLLIIFNLSQIDFKNLTSPTNTIVFVEIAASLCAIVILLIYKKSKELIEKTKSK